MTIATTTARRPKGKNLDFHAIVCLAASTTLVTLEPASAQFVNCGGVFAEDCSVCDQGHGETWCNGDCEWTGRGCESKQSVAATIQSMVTPVHAQLTADTTRQSDLVLTTRWSFAGLGVMGVVYFVFGLLYRRKVVHEILMYDRIKDRSPDHNASSTRHIGLFGCLMDSSTCAYTTFCLPLVVGKNMEAGRAGGFWPWCCITYLGMLSPITWLASVILKTWSGRRLKRNLDLPHNFFQDFCLNFWCLPCEVGRESLEVDEAAWVKVTCYNKVENQFTPAKVEEAVEKAVLNGGAGFCAGFRKACG